MMATYSPHHEEREAAHLHSPKSISHFDPHSAIREIRRSLSRSPSKGSELRQYPFRSPGSGTLPFSPSPLSPSRKSTSENLLQIANMVSPHSNRASQGTRFQRPILRRTAQPNGITRIRTSPKSPSKRVLADSSDSGNASPMPLRKRSSGEGEREAALNALTSGEAKENDWSQNDTLTRKVTQTRQEKRRSGGALIADVAPLSPMKRSDGPRMDDTPGLESPSAKRRSVHGAGLDFSIFESDGPDGGMFNDKRSQDDNDWFGNVTPLPSSRFSTIPKRSSSLRKSTLQQRQLDRPSNMKLNSIMDWDKSWPEATPTTNSKKGLRLSLDNHLQPLPRDSPFSSQGSLLNASIHPITSSQNSISQQPPRHPLSRTLTQSSSQPSEQDDSPTHEPIHRHNRPLSHDFSKSLPIGASRPESFSEQNEFSSQGSFATPGNYKAAKPLPAAFMSTGLISKKNRNVDDPNAGLPKAHMPDTPCKKQPVIFQPNEKFAAPNAVADRAPRQSFGASNTPMDAPHGFSKISAFPFAKSVGIFGARSSKHNLLREGSFASIGGDEKTVSRSPLSRANSQSTESTDYPPTPTKHTTEPAGRGSVSPSPHNSGLSINPVAARSAYGTGKGSISPRLDRFDRASPHTPLENFFPPDPSGLSISGRVERPVTRHGHEAAASIVPATPTGPREYFTNFSNRPSLNLASAEASNVDNSLTSRFEKVDLIGSGEFSQVYRVSQPPEVSPYHKIYSMSTSRPSSRGSVPEKVWAVKRSRYPYTGARDRQRKIHEVDVLKALGHSDHVVTFVDSWEEQGHLYIQTEFCEEGTLDVFLAQVGLKARLDDFRIWKILLELSMGLKHIHDCGYIHLDLKPANVLITFEGVLKIADFGMATRWPASAGIEGEGDREYIGPEVLMGRYDKPADIFALGLIMLETAGNVELPDNGVSWQKLRNGDMSDVPSLTWSSGTSGILRDSSGNPISPNASLDAKDQVSYPQDVEVIESEQTDDTATQHDGKTLDHPRSGELISPPQFMVDPSHESALDRIVRWMISPDPNDRPVASDLLNTEGVRWAEARRRAGATVFEGNWGPADEILAEDAEMIDV
ncbi:mitosis inhibitor protein kinase swe1 [Exophiala dermatitidis]|uniref:Mitosis inhibitor protein kinase SWE1 n=2 Tax=Exophiala dermatitidis TaxID=5970 RepID=H6C6Y3_EXODN|nr:mitosis inhibitor protein kinase SWE1 [Exophiala dermatitidis NIH/UT8656]KAJ4532712.1 mitosis inhibitor protein kinase swe1 [Exophiala dermatitidis]EHY59479.1 mitosis inhibitor protein kinase SWE1 [Exophiala dermatitidis NIH/UT8656]KAJ4546776.1 mitosis inhibitor protein kinase swe1 [Exophiala dermatitidis]KAJ4583889.1 mitosis inhibitor protein kinase swe1 [Exophiala dermatitidis]KAJ4630835.1 mitosis inhibitor protein kinase swe1 [Exophiala dermatitidis]